MCNYRHPGLRRVWEVGSEPQSLPPLPSLPWPPREFQKRPSCCYTRHFRARCFFAQAAELLRVPALPCRREHRESNFRQKYMFWKLFFVLLPGGTQHIIFTMNYHLGDPTVFDLFVSKWPSPFLDPGPPKGDPGSPGRVWRDSLRLFGEPIYRKTPDQPPLGAVMLYKCSYQIAIILLPVKRV